MPRVKKPFRVLVFVFFVIIVSLVLLEFAARFILKQPYYAFPQGYFVRNNDYGYALAANFKGRYSQPEFSISIDTNAMAMRDGDHSADPAGFRLLGIGDSLAFGVGVELEETYLSLLEKMLSFAKGNIRVIKAGVPGYSTYNEMKFLERECGRLRPDMVLVQFWWDDLGCERLTYLEDAGFLVSNKIKGNIQFRLFLNRHLRSYALLRRLFTLMLKRPLFKTPLTGAALHPLEFKEPFRITLGQFDAIESICRKNKAECIFILIPSRDFVQGTKDRQHAWETWVELVKNSKFAYIDLLPALKKACSDKTGVFFKADPHLSAYGNRIVAETVYEKLASKIPRK